MTGVPAPKLTWYHNGEEVVFDAFKELAEDGSLTVSSIETKHSGIYKLVAVNSAGRIEKEVNLFVEQETQQPMTAPQITSKSTLIPAKEFGDFVSKCHDNDNEGFNDQYKVGHKVVHSLLFLHLCNTHRR